MTSKNMGDNLVYAAMSVIQPDITFSPYLSTGNSKERGQRNPRIKHAFIHSFFIDTLELPRRIRGNNGEEYKILYNEFIVPAEAKKQSLVPVIGSFQQWDIGNFVVIRFDRNARISMEKQDA
ncbi:MAG: hypothetical protein AB7F19_07515 [Candidatus Babeliales bacterium]